MCRRMQHALLPLHSPLEITPHKAGNGVSSITCRNRHCPKCQNTARAQWVERRKQELLPVEYFHVVFTIPEQLNTLALQNPQVVYKILFATSAATLETIAADPKHLGARIGFFSILHTWGSNLLHHPHVHCVATGGGLSLDGTQWISCRPGFFLPVRVLSDRFRNLFLQSLDSAFAGQQLKFCGQLAGLQTSFPQLLQQLETIPWVVHAKPPFGGPQQVVDYLGRYTHRVAISNNRLESIEDNRIGFQYKDYRSGERYKSRHMSLAPEEVIRRFLLHTLPPGFQRIRHYGLLASRNKLRLLALCIGLLNVVALILPSAAQLVSFTRQLLSPALLCPVCGIGQMIRIGRLPRCTAFDPEPLDSS